MYVGDIHFGEGVTVTGSVTVGSCLLSGFLLQVIFTKKNFIHLIKICSSVYM